METKNENGDQLEVEQINKTTTTMKKKKVSRGMHVLSVVLFMLRRRRPRTKPINTGFWRRMIESVRKSPSTITTMPSCNSLNTMCLSPPPPPLSETTEVVGEEEEDDNNNDDEVFTEASSKTGISGYGSAMCLRDLGYNDDDDDDVEDDTDHEGYTDVEGGDDMIDEKAEEFIMRFYEQMKMQNQVYTERCRSKSG